MYSLFWAKSSVNTPEPGVEGAQDHFTEQPPSEKNAVTLSPCRQDTVQTTRIPW